MANIDNPDIFTAKGHRFASLTVLAFDSKRKNGAHWLFLCDCGARKVIRAANVKNGHTKTCGCIKKSGLRRTHGMRQSREYKTWCKMHERCGNEKSFQYKWYGGRGIKVCHRWSSFENFYADMGPRPPGMFIERNDVNGDYSPENCRWATREEQSRNKSSTRYIVYNGVKMSLLDALELSRISRNAFYLRLKMGWSEHRAIHEPLRHRIPSSAPKS